MSGSRTSGTALRDSRRTQSRLPPVRRTRRCWSGCPGCLGRRGRAAPADGDTAAFTSTLRTQRQLYGRCDHRRRKRARKKPRTFGTRAAMPPDRTIKVLADTYSANANLNSLSRRAQRRFVPLQHSGLHGRCGDGAEASGQRGG